MAFAIDISFESGRARESVRTSLDDLVAGGPFAVSGLVHVNSHQWVLSLQQASPSVTANFAKAIELLLLLAREFDILAVTRTDVEQVAQVAVAS